uniref:K Homology domain-containing protein n=1 Tax=Salix viminalis TaxID=40686 RepID=A0A6N2LAB4_SALVM
MQQQKKHHRHSRSPRRPLIELQPGQVAFRVVFHVSKIDGLISHSGSVISRIRVETGCLVHCEEAVKGSEHRAFMVVGSASPERKVAVGEGETVEVSGAQEAVIMFLERMWGVDAKKDGGQHEGYCVLLVNTSQIGAVAGSSTVAVKKAVIDVTSCLQDCSQYKKDRVDLSLRAVRRRSGSSGEPPCSLLPTHSENITIDGSHKKPNEQLQVQFRMICSHGAAGSIIGKGGSIVRALQNETGASITLVPITNSSDRLVTVSASENPESSHSPAQNALLLVVARSIEHDIEKARCMGLIGEISVTATLLLPSNRVSCLIGRGGRIDSETIEATGADIQILQGDQFFDSASKNDVVVQITGKEKNVQNALFQITCKLRDNLLPTGMLNGSRSGNPNRRAGSLYRRAGEITKLHQTACKSLDSNQETSLEIRVDQITGSSTLAVKKAVIDVTTCLQEYHPYKKDEVDLSLGAVRRRNGSSSEPPRPLLPTHSEIIAADGSHKKPNEQFQVQFRMICSHGAAGSVIGTGGSIVRALQNETGASITFAPPITNSDDRLVTVSAMENLESSHSPAQNALVLVFARSIEHDIEKARSLGLIGEISVTATLLLPSNRVTCLIGRGGRIDAEMKQTTGADIQILQGDQFPDFASMNDVVVQITGEEKNVQNALFQVTSKLRENLLPTEMLNGLRAGSPYRKAGEIAMLHRSVGESLNSNQERNMKKRVDQVCNTPSSLLQLPQITGRSTEAVKKAVIDVTSWLQDCPPYKEDEVNLSLGAFRRRSGSSSESPCSVLPTHSENIAVDGSHKKPNEQLQVQFSMICSHGAAGSVIGTGGSIVRALQNETGASITFAPPITNSDDRLVTVSAMENLESSHSPAQNALVLVFARSIEHDIEKARSLGLIGEISVTATLLLPSNRVTCLIGRGGRIVAEMIETTGVDIQILQGDQFPDFASMNDVVVEISGEYKNVQNALFQVTSKLRDNLLPTEMRTRLRAGSPCRRAGEITTRRQSAGSISRLNSQFPSANKFGKKSGSRT